MRMKTYRAHSMAEALSAARAELGGNAVVLSTRSFRAGGLLGLGRREIVEIIAADQPPDRRRPGADRRPSAERPRSGAATGDAERRGLRAPASGDAPPPARAADAPAVDEATLRRLREAVGRARARRSAPAAPAASEHPARPLAASPPPSGARSTAPAANAAPAAEADPPRPAEPVARRFRIQPSANGSARLVAPTARGDQAPAPRIEPAPPAASPAPAPVPEAAPRAAAAPVPLTSGEQEFLTARGPRRAAETTGAAREAIARDRPAPADVDAPAGDDRPAPAAGETAPAAEASPAPAVPATIFTPAPSEDRTFEPGDGADVRDPELVRIDDLVSRSLGDRRLRAEADRAPVADTVGAAAGGLRPALDRLKETLLDQDLPEALAGVVVDRVAASLDGDPAPGELRAAARRVLVDLVPCRPPSLPRPSIDRGPHRIAVVGPTGVGKTTTLAKLAALLKLRHGLDVGLVTADTYRIAAVDQLRSYAEIIGLPLEVVGGPEEVPDALRRHGGRDAVLVDTAGRSQNDAERLIDLRGTIDRIEADEVHLVLSATAGPRVLKREAEAFVTVGADRLILTKLDEAATIGAAIALARSMQLPFSCLTTGQEVPQDIESARPERLVERLLPAEEVE